MIDGIAMANHVVVVALGINQYGEKAVLDKNILKL